MLNSALFIRPHDFSTVLIIFACISTCCAFSDCSSLTSITIPSSVTSIGNFAFYNCESLTSITIPPSVASIGDYAFSSCNFLASITVDKSNSVYDSRNNCNAIIETSTNTLIAGCQSTVILSSVTNIGNFAFVNCESLTSITIPPSVTSIGLDAFPSCSSLTSITIPSSVTSIGSNPFMSCSSLSSIIVDKNNRVYDSRNSCNAIIETLTNTLVVGCQSTLIPTSVTCISHYAFYKCSSLSSITIPSSVTSIGGWAFDGCSSLNEVTCSSATPPSIQSSTFEDSPKNYLYVPKGSKSAYQNTWEWSEFKNIEEYSTDILATGISLSPGSLSLVEGETATIFPTIYPSNVTDKCVTWKSSNSSVATVSSTGVVTAKSAGTCKITATTNDGSNLSETCNVTVNAKVIKTNGISLNYGSLILTEGETSTLSATVYPSNATDKTVTWKSSNTSVATVSNSGVVTAKSAGTCKITATTNDGSNLSESCNVTVNAKDIKATGIKVSKASISLTEGETETLTATVYPSDATDKTVSWTSSDPDVATVSSSGVVTAKSAGTCKITAKTNDGTNLSESCVVEVKSAVILVEAIWLDYESKVIGVGETFTITAEVAPSGASCVLEWTSLNQSVAIVDSDGNVTALSDGTCLINVKATDGTNISSQCIVTVQPSSITTICADEAASMIYNLDGTRSSQLRQGIKLIRHVDGRVEKAFVK